MKQPRVKIHLASQNLCTGCAACANACPQKCVHMEANMLGSLCPSIDSKHCINCELCIKSCPALVGPVQTDYTCAYTLQTNNENILNNSSSGGAFYEIARTVINDMGGVVFGVRFNGIHVQHDWTETIDGLKEFMGSKYVQSDIGYMYVMAKEFLNDGRYVLFTGTPCQIAGLKKFLMKPYEKLLTIDLICHGVPNPVVWEKYMTRFIQKKRVNEIVAIKFRVKFDAYTQRCNYYNFYTLYKQDKKEKLFLEERRKNLFYSYFSRNIYRESCYNCCYRNINASFADFTIGDSVIPNQYPNDRGMVSTLIIHSIKGKELLDKIRENFSIYSNLELSHVYDYYKQAKLDEQEQRVNRPWRLVSFLSKRIPLEYLRLLYTHDKLHVVIKRKIKRHAKKI